MELANPQHEAFAQHVASGCSMREAAKRSGHIIGAGNYGARLADNPRVSQRIIELQAVPHIPSTDQANTNPTTPPSNPVLSYIEKPWIITELVSNHRLARRLKDVTASNQSLKTLAQIGGLLDTPRLSGVQSTQALALMGIAEIHAMLKAQVGTIPKEQRAHLLGAAPELAELMNEPDVSQSDSPSECTPEPGV